MCREWFISGQLLEPYEFAKADYRQYPAFSVPYHPPAYPVMLGIVFLITGISYVWARMFVAACFGLGACFLFGIGRRLDASPLGAFVSSLLLLTTPELARWSRTTMSEVPGLLFITVASYLFLSWVENGHARLSWLAFGTAGVAFLCRVTTAGVMPAWFLYLILTKRWPHLRSLHLWVPAGLYLAAGAAWTRFAAAFSKYEIGLELPTSTTKRLSWNACQYYLTELPEMMGLGLALVVFVLILAAVYRKVDRIICFGFCWFVSNFLFVIAVNDHAENRYFSFALVGLLIMSAFPFAERFRQGKLGRFILVFSLLAVVGNAALLLRIPDGLVGHQQVAQKLADLPRPGNVLLACPWESDLIFRYRAERPHTDREMLRGDRTLAIRLYAGYGIEPEYFATDTSDVLDILQKGRVRYLVTVVDDLRSFRVITPEMTLAHETVLSLPKMFAKRGEFLMRRDARARYELYVWEYLGQLPQGPSEIRVKIPTADLDL